MLREEYCSLCRGKGVAEVLEANLAFDLGWHRAGRFVTREAMEEAIASHPNLYRWADCACPRCDGAGSYSVEYVTCKIF